MTTTISNLTCPAGTTGLACEPWSKGEIYAVAANWAQASSPVLTYGPRGWRGNGMQVADYRHRTEAAMEAVIREAIASSEGIPSNEVDQDEIDAILADATEIESEDTE